MTATRSPGPEIVAILVAAVLCLPADGAQDVLFRDEFASLADWKPVSFSRIPRQTSYVAESSAAGDWLKTSSSNAASGIAHVRQYDVRAFPKLRFRWKVSNSLAHPDETTKAGDDFALRIYVMFERDGLFPKLRQAIVRNLYGADLPQRAIVYVWASRRHAARAADSPYGSQVKYVFLENGATSAGVWTSHELDVAADYRALFGEEPPDRARLGIMSDTDDSGGQVTGWIDYIEAAR